MNVLTNQRHEVEDRHVFSILEEYDLETGERKVLKEFDCTMEAPSYMKSGKEIVYNAEGKIYRFDLKTGESTLVDTGFCNHCNNDHVLSPDNTKIAVSHHTYEDGQSRIYIVPFDTGVPTLITPIAPSYLHGWSPDGKTLAYCAERNGEYDIYTIPVEGGQETQLTNVPGLNDGPEYSPCGEYIWFNSVRTGLMQAFRMKKDGSEQTQMTSEESNNWFPHISPDGEKVVYIAYKKGDVAPGDHPANKNVEIRMMNADGTDKKTLISLFGGQGTLNVNPWSPDSKKFAFVSYRLK